MKRLSSFSMVWHQVGADARLMWGELLFYYVALIASTVICLTWDGPKQTGMMPVVEILHGVAVLLPLYLATVVVMRDPPGDMEAFWQAKPVTRPTLLTAKLIFLGLSVVLPPVLFFALSSAALAGADGASTVAGAILGKAAWWVLLTAAAAAWAGTRLRFVWIALILLAIAFATELLDGLLYRFEAGHEIIGAVRTATLPVAIPWLLALVAAAYLLPRRSVLMLLLIGGLPMTLLLNHGLLGANATAERPDVPMFSVKVAGDRLLHLKDQGVFVGLNADLEIRDLSSPYFAVLRKVEAELEEAGATRRFNASYSIVHRPYTYGSWRSAFDSEGERAAWTLGALIEDAKVFNEHGWHLSLMRSQTVFRYPDFGDPIRGDAIWRADLDYEVHRFDKIAVCALKPGAVMRAQGIEVTVLHIEPEGPHAQVMIGQRWLDPNLFPTLNNPAFVLVWPEEPAVCAAVGERFDGTAQLGPVVWNRKSFRFGHAESVEGGNRLFEPDGLAKAELWLVNRVSVGWRTVQVEHGVSPPEE